MTNLLILGTRKGLFLYRRGDDTAAWKMQDHVLREWEITSICIHPSGRILAGTGNDWFGPTLRVSDDVGQTWRQIEAGPAYTKESGYELKRIWQIAPGHSNEPDTLYAGVEAAGLFVTHDRGDHWSLVEGLMQHHTRPYWMPGAGGLCLHTICVDPFNPNRLFTGISAAGAFRSDDRGATWTICNQNLPVLFTGSRAEEVCCCVHKMACDPSRQGRLYMQYHGGFFRSDDAASTWLRMETGLPSGFGFPLALTASGDLFAIPLAGDSNRTFTKGAVTIYRSRDSAESWEPLRSGLPDEPNFGGVLRDAMHAHTNGNSTISFGTTTGNAFVSDDAGENWSTLAAQFPRIHCVRLGTIG